MRNMQRANRVTPRPQPSPVTPPPVSTHPKRRCQTHGQQNSTEPYRILQNPTEIRVCACAHARAWCFSSRHSREGANPRAAAAGVQQVVLPRHSREGGNPRAAGVQQVVLSRHSREGGNPRAAGVQQVVLSRHSREGGNPRARPRWRRYLLSAWNAPRPQQIRRITWSRRPRTLMPIDRREPSERRGLLRGTVWIVLELENDGGAI